MKYEVVVGLSRKREENRAASEYKRYNVLCSDNYKRYVYRPLSRLNFSLVRTLRVDCVFDTNYKLGIALPG